MLVQWHRHKTWQQPPAVVKEALPEVSVLPLVMGLRRVPPSLGFWFMVCKARSLDPVSCRVFSCSPIYNSVDYPESGYPNTRIWYMRFIITKGDSGKLTPVSPSLLDFKSNFLFEPSDQGNDSLPSRISFYFILFYGVPRPGIRAQPQLWPMPQVQCWIL